MTIVGILILSLVAFTPANLAPVLNTAGVPAQRELTVPLSKRGKINSYSVRETAHDSFELIATNVEHPIKKTPVAGEVELKYKCGQIPYTRRLFFNHGVSRPERVECLIILTPRIIIRDEEE